MQSYLSSESITKVNYIYYSRQVCKKPKYTYIKNIFACVLWDPKIDESILQQGEEAEQHVEEDCWGIHMTYVRARFVNVVVEPHSVGEAVEMFKFVEEEVKQIQKGYELEYCQLI